MRLDKLETKKRRNYKGSYTDKCVFMYLHMVL